MIERTTPPRDGSFAASPVGAGADELHYPYGPDPLLPAWGSVKGRLLALLAIVGAVLGTWLGAERGVNEVALLAVLPGVLAFTLAFAPEPRTRLGTIAKDMLCMATALSPLSGSHIHYNGGARPRPACRRGRAGSTIASGRQGPCAIQADVERGAGVLAMIVGLDPMAALAWERALLLLGPLFLAGGLVIATRPTPRQASAAMLAFLWQVPSLLALNLLAREAGWWTFTPAPGAEVLGFPVDVWIGWAFLWGPVMALLERPLGIPVILCGAAILDAASMPFLDSVRLTPGWFWAEPVFLAAGLLPGMLLARWTRLDIRPLGRTLIHAVGWGLYMLFALPTVALAVEGRDIVDALHWPAGILGWAGMPVLLFALLAGATAAFEFATVGQGTPVPVDPPKGVVMSGPYAYVANPMQVTSAIVMALLALHYASLGLAFVTASFLLFDAVYAAHYNKVHIARAMPREWERYKAAVPDWRVRWTPYRPGTPLLVASTTGDAGGGITAGITADPGLHVRRRRALGVSRLVFSCAETGIRARGVSALSRVLERRSLPWAFLAWGLRLPLVLQVLQVVTHAGIVCKTLGHGMPLAPHRPSRAGNPLTKRISLTET